MFIVSDQLYHIYNQGNNGEVIFKERNDYLEFLRRFRERVSFHCEVISYCLMPNHFHFMVNATQESAEPVILAFIQSTQLANGFRVLCSGYANFFNKKYGRSGSLFRQKTKAKMLEVSDENYPFVCFQYIHQNPVVAGLCKNLEDWEFSSFRDYCGDRQGSLVKKSLAYSLIGISESQFYEESFAVIDSHKLRGLY